MGITITGKGAGIINDFLKDPSQKTSVSLAQEGWTLEKGAKDSDGRIVFRSPTRDHGYWAQDLYYSSPKNTAYFDENPYFQCEVDRKHQKVEPACEMDGNMTTEAEAPSLKARILMGALYPSEVGADFVKAHFKKSKH
ncbi:MAG: hypothetical protein U1F57_11110 [bacterium]